MSAGTGKPERVQKYLSSAGVVSRRKAEELVAAGKVYINGKPAAIGQTVIPGKDTVTVEGRKVAPQEGARTYLMLNKPRGFITTMSDDRGRKCVASLISDVGKRVYPVGRLDRDSEGLLLFTDDGELADALTRPSSGVSKKYLVTVKTVPTEEQMTALSEGVMLDGRMTLPASVNIVLTEPDRTVLEIILREGRNRQIRRMLENAGIETARLKRVAEGPVSLGNLPCGKYRMLTRQEISALKAAAKR